MTAQLFNNVSDVLLNPVDTADTEIQIQSGNVPSISPGDYTPIYVIRANGSFEIMHVTAVSGTTLTVLRAQEGTDPLVFESGVSVQIRPTRQSLLEMKPDVSEVTTSTGTQALADALDSRVIYVATIADLKLLDGALLLDGQGVRVTTTGRAGNFIIKAGAPPVSDPQEGIYVVIDGNFHAVRQYGQTDSTSPKVNAAWFGLSTDNSPSANSAALNAAAGFSSTLKISNGVYDHAGFTIGVVGGGFTLEGEDQIQTKLRYIGSSTSLSILASYAFIRDISLYGDDSGVNYWTTGSVALRPDGNLSMENVNVRFWDKVWDWNGGFYHKINTCQFRSFNIFSDNLNGNNFTFDGCKMGFFNEGFGVSGGTGNFSFINGAIEAWSGQAVSQESGSDCVLNLSNNYIENYPGPADRGINQIVAAYICFIAKGGVHFHNNNIQTKGIFRGISAAWISTGLPIWVEASGNKWILSSTAENDLEYAYRITGDGSGGVSNIRLNDPKAVKIGVGHTQAYPFTYVSFNSGQVEYVSGTDAFTNKPLIKLPEPLSLTGGWTNDTDPNNNPLGYTISPDGYVNVRGVIDGGSSTGPLVATLPVGARPTNYHYEVSANTGGVVVVLRVLPTGDIRVESPSTPTNVIVNIWFLLDG